MLKHIFFVLFFFFNVVQAQNELEESERVPNIVIKAGPRIFSPRIAVEKVFNKDLSMQIEGRGYLYPFIQKGFRVEPSFRYYIDGIAPDGIFLNVKAGFGYFDYNHLDLKTNGINLGGGLNFGIQMQVGKKNTLFEIFGGFQIMAPIFLNAENLNGSSSFLESTKRDYLAINYLTIALPLELGIRFGIFTTKKI